MRIASALLSLAVWGLAEPAAAQTEAGIGMAEPALPGSGRIFAEEEWAGTLVEALGLANALPADAETAEHFSLLCAEGAELHTAAGGRRAPADGAFRIVRDVAPREPGEPLRVVVDVPGTALYQLWVEGTGRQRWTVDQRALPHLDVTPLGVGMAPALVPLQAGPHELAAYMGRAARVDRFELVAVRQPCVAPEDGWHAGRPLSFAAASHTLVRALGIERLLPEEKLAIQVAGAGFSSASPVEAGGADRGAVGRGPAELLHQVRLEEPGVYSLRVRVRGKGPQIWSVDGRHRAALAPRRASKKFVWAHVLTARLASGEHAIRALMPDGAAVDEVHIVRHRATPGDHLDLLDQMGFPVGAPSTLVSRADGFAALSKPAFVEMASDFAERMARAGGGDPLVAVGTAALEPLYSRPLAPVLPSEL
jgi:hypothetical protein